MAPGTVQEGPNTQEPANRHTPQGSRPNTHTVESHKPQGGEPTTHTTNEPELIYQGHGEWAQAEGEENLITIRQLDTAGVKEEIQLQIENEDLMMAHLVLKKGYPNRFGARIPIKCKWDIQVLEQKLQGYEDLEVVEWMKFGWPSGRLPLMGSPAKTFKNHKGALDHPKSTPEVHSSGKSQWSSHRTIQEDTIQGQSKAYPP